MELEIVISLILFFASLLSIVFAYLAYKRSKKNEVKIKGKIMEIFFRYWLYQSVSR